MENMERRRHYLQNLWNRKGVRAAVFLLCGFLAGWLVFRSPSGPAVEHSPGTETVEEVWTCSMHPQIRMGKPGKCPLCGMDLIPLRSNATASEAVTDPDAIQLSDEAIALANVQTTRVSRQNPVKEIRLYGTIQPDERSLQSQAAHVGGRIERLFVDFTGETVQKDKTLAVIYSPELFTAQQELLEALRMQPVQPRLVEAAREKLRLWKLTPGQITAIESSGVVSPLVEIKASTSGIVVGKNVNPGDYVEAGNVLFDIADLSKVWAMFEAYETDLPFLRTGDRLDFTLQAFPGRQFGGRIAFIDPLIDKASRTAKVRVEVGNPNLELKPEMYATASVTAPLRQYRNQIVVPQSAVLWTGKRSVVYVRQPEYNSPVFKIREIELGPWLGDSYVVASGLADGEEIVTNGVFSVDASAQLEGKRSMMNTAASRPVTGHEGHNMPGMEGMSNMAGMGTMSAPNSTARSEHAMITARGSCEMCKDRIEKAAKSVSGVTSASWDLATQQLHLNYDPARASVDAVSLAVAKAGHDTDKYKADQATYDALPACCKYRK